MIHSEGLLINSYWQILKEEREIYEWYCEECIWFGYGEEADYNTLFTSGIEEININHFNDMKCGDFNTIGCDNCI